MSSFQTSHGALVPVAKPVSIGEVWSRLLPLGERRRVSLRHSSAVQRAASGNICYRVPHLDALKGEGFLRGRVPGPPCVHIAPANKQAVALDGSLPRRAPVVVFLALYPSWVHKTFPPSVFNQS